MFFVAALEIVDVNGHASALSTSLLYLIQPWPVDIISFGIFTIGISISSSAAGLVWQFVEILRGLLQMRSQGWKKMKNKNANGLSKILSLINTALINSDR